MKEIDRLLKQWIPVNTIIRKEIRDAIVKAIEKAQIRGYEAAHDEVRAD
jgi:hypothetical protein